MKIAVDLTSLADNFTGIERFALNVTEEMLRQNKSNQYILVFKEEIYGAFKEYEDCPMIDMLVLPRRNKLWFYQITLYGALRKLKADIFFFPAFPAPFFLRKKGMVNTIFDMGCWDCPDAMTGKMACYFRIMYRNAVKHSERIVTISEFSSRRIQKILGVAREKISIVYCAVSDDLYEEPESSWEKVREVYELPEKYLLCLSTLEPRKNLQLLLQAFAELIGEGSCEYDLVLAGRKGWKLDEVLGNIPQTIAQRIHITGYVEEQDLPMLYAHAKLFVFPSRYEGFGIPPLEAMASGVPVLCSDLEVLREVLGEKAEYFRSDDRESLKAALSRCLESGHVFPAREELITYSRRYSYKSSARQLCRELNIL